MSVKLEFNIPKITAKLTPKYQQAQAALDIQVLKDSNYYIPKDEGTLEASGVIASGGGKVEWNTPYAREQYYEKPNKSHDTNPNARMKWFEFAKAQWGQQWVKMVNGFFGGKK